MTAADDAPAYLAEAVAAEPPQHNDRLDALRDLLRQARDKQLLAAELTERAKRTTAEVQDLTMHQLPAMMLELGMRTHELPAEGNHPEYTVRCKPYYKAVISSEWSPTKQAEGFDVLRARDAGDLIKNTVTVSFGRGQEAKADELCRHVAETGMTFERGRAVQWNTLTAWVKEQVLRLGVEKAFTDEELRKIGAYVGSVVEVKPAKE
jgi:hypothetical protein